MKFFQSKGDYQRKTEEKERGWLGLIILIVLVFAFCISLLLAFSGCIRMNSTDGFNSQYVPPGGKSASASKPYPFEIIVMRNGRWLMKAGTLWFKPIETDSGIADWQFKYYILNWIKIRRLNVEKIIFREGTEMTRFVGIVDVVIFVRR